MHVVSFTGELVGGLADYCSWLVGWSVKWLIILLVG